MTLASTGLFKTVGTYLGVPQTLDPAAAGAKAAIIGLPFDSGRHPKRVGARLGPAAIRMMSTDMVRHYRPDSADDFDPIRALGLVDVGDVAVTSGMIEESVERMDAAIAAVIASGAMPIGLGGDGVISVPMMQALARAHPGLAVLHFDSHTDAYPEGGNAIDLNPATTFSFAAEKRYVDPSVSLHFGLRGTAYVPGVFDYTRSLGYHVIPLEALDDEGPAAILERFRAVIGDRPVFICFDMDVFDPSVAPGVFTPAWGGLTAREGLRLIRGLKGLNMVGFDVNTTTPTYDVQGLTAWLAATVVLEFCYLAAASLGLEGERRPAW
ncbi:arginase family protein [Thalassobaculum sp.]|uniref:arginase family protein n=1 Tax=Thalassobaculum sp. TaxID=2022740 RepID=UPI0032EF58D9